MNEWNKSRCWPTYFSITKPFSSGISSLINPLSIRSTQERWYQFRFRLRLRIVCQFSWEIRNFAIIFASAHWETRSGKLLKKLVNFSSACPINFRPLVDRGARDKNENRFGQTRAKLIDFEVSDQRETEEWSWTCPRVPREREKNLNTRVNVKAK